MDKHLLLLRHALLVSVLAAAVMTSGCTEKPGITLSTEYQAVFLDNGQVFFGTLENPGGPYPILTNVFYIQRQANQQTKEVKNVLVRRGEEWHAPDRMYLNTKHIVLIEPVGPDSAVAKLIKQAKEQKPAARQ
jgi:hypothetical protein